MAKAQPQIRHRRTSGGRLDDLISKKQLGLIIALAALIAGHYLGWPEALTNKVITVTVTYLGAQGVVDVTLAAKGAKKR